MTDTTSSSYSEAQALRIEMENRLAELEKAVAAATAAPGWATSVQFRLRELRGSLASHVTSVEAPDGLLAEIMDAEPRLSSGVDRMKADHRRIAGELDTLIETAVSSDPSTLRERVFELMRDMVVHRQHGSDLVYEAFSRDIGGQGGS